MTEEQLQKGRMISNEIANLKESVKWLEPFNPIGRDKYLNTVSLKSNDTYDLTLYVSEETLKKVVDIIYNDAKKELAVMEKEFEQL